ncbi:2-C-methyl-D-erythritol 4-phosphate cytidylyltransferase [Thioploca ingrica]|uniref:2-C-methyl-D-erythritol 4-phosphate cytidylyltransferase n=1 Tax=Thioploca ingrica TaxID=40754 RepID=A0A090AHA6_9GAMM|nr:2-C-methyl-D-erythritol 4-phosphate cytidylyltransferase [Thioploca ingrica]
MSNNIPHYWAIVPAAGQGSRMGHTRPKQYLPLHGKPILQHTLERLNLPRIKGIVVCIAANDSDWQTLTLPRTVMSVVGGVERCHSVLNGLQALQPQAQPNDWVLVHDAARPCVRPADIDKLMTQLADHPVGGLLAVPVRDTMKRVSALPPQPLPHPFWGERGVEVIETVNRENLWHALTPQMFRLEALTLALQHVLNQQETVTDEAQAMERQGYRPVLIEGHADNIKVTLPQDLNLAELYLQQQDFS